MAAPPYFYVDKNTAYAVLPGVSYDKTFGINKIYAMKHEGKRLFEALSIENIVVQQISRDGEFHS